MKQIDDTHPVVKEHYIPTVANQVFEFQTKPPRLVSAHPGAVRRLTSAHPSRFKQNQFSNKQLLQTGTNSKQIIKTDTVDTGLSCAYANAAHAQKTHERIQSAHMRLTRHKKLTQQARFSLRNISHKTREHSHRQPDVGTQLRQSQPVSPPRQRRMYQETINKRVERRTGAKISEEFEQFNSQKASTSASVAALVRRTVPRPRSLIQTHKLHQDNSRDAGVKTLAVHSRVSTINKSPSD